MSGDERRSQQREVTMTTTTNTTSRFVLGLVFDRVLAERGAQGADDLASPDDWRGRIDSTIEVDDLDEDDARVLVGEAVVFFTGTVAQVTVQPNAERPHLLQVRVQADGYRAGPAGP